VDLNRAVHGSNDNWECIKEAIESVDIPVCLSGGLRKMSDVEEAFDIGASSVSLGTLALSNPIILQEVVDLYNENVYVSMDYKKNKLWGYGWTFPCGYDFFDFLKIIEDMGVKNIIYTDIERDGTMTGYDQFFLLDVLDKTSMNVIISGGIGSLEDVLMLRSEGYWNWGKGKLIGVICGTALYEGKIQDEIKVIKTTGCDLIGKRYL